METDKYGNPTDGSELIYCCFPDCGCDGARLCMAKNGASEHASSENLEGMWLRKDRRAIKARNKLIGSISQEEREPPHAEA